MKKFLLFLIIICFVSVAAFGEINAGVRNGFSYLGFPSSEIGGFSNSVNQESYSFDFLQADNGVDSEKYKKDKKLRDAGIGLFATGLAGPALGGTLAAVGALGAVGSASQGDVGGATAGSALIITGGVIAGTTGALFIPGVIMWIIGDLRMRGTID